MATLGLEKLCTFVPEYQAMKKQQQPQHMSDC